MNTTKTIAALFDFDGVIMDTETQYTVFWDEQGRKYLNEKISDAVSRDRRYYKSMKSISRTNPKHSSK